MIKKLTIVGVGLIGGSLALALKAKGYCEWIVGFDTNTAALDAAMRRGVIDHFSSDPEETCADADMVFVSVPVRSTADVFETIRPYLKDGAIVADAGSCKASVVQAAEAAFGDSPVHFVPGHPIAGREKSGVTAADPLLFLDHKVILTPTATTDPTAVQVVTKMWEAAGAEVEALEVVQHDRIFASTSHLPHVLAFALVDTLSSSDVIDEIFQYAAGGFRDFSRIAGGDPTMWRDICLDNREAILDALEKFKDRLNLLSQAIEQADGESIFDKLSHAQKTRNSRVLNT